MQNHLLYIFPCMAMRTFQETPAQQQDLSTTRCTCGTP